MEPEEMPGAESVEVPASSDDSVDIVTDGSGESMADSFAAARAELAELMGSSDGEASTGQESDEGGDSGESPSEPADSRDAGDSSNQAQPSRQYTLQGALDHVLTLVGQGRESELTGEERGIYNRFREESLASREQEIRQQAVEEHSRQQSDWQELTNLFQELHQDRMEDEALFAARLLEDPDLGHFYNQMMTEYPELATGVPASFSREQYEAAVQTAKSDGITEFRSALETSLEQLATEAGVNYQEHRGRAGGKLGTLLNNIFNAAVEATASKMAEGKRGAIAASERKAAEQEATAMFADKTIVVPRPLVGSGERAESTGAITMQEALEEARRELANAR